MVHNRLRTLHFCSNVGIHSLLRILLVKELNEVSQNEKPFEIR